MRNSTLEDRKKANREKTMEYLSKSGFYIKEVPVEEHKYSKMSHYVLLNGEHVGNVYQNSIYLYRAMPSLYDMGVLTDMERVCILYSNDEAVNGLPQILEELKKSCADYDRIVREYRKNKVKEYFKDR